MLVDFDEIINGILRDGYFVKDNFLNEKLAIGLKKISVKNEKEGFFKNASISNLADKSVHKNIRNDQIQWIENDSSDLFEIEFSKLIDDLTIFLNRNIFLGIRSNEFHYAVFQPGSIYLKHLDAFKAENKRVVSVICYLNPKWTIAMGGALKLYTLKKTIEIPPISGRLVCFLSEEIPHEVLASTHDRYSITGWLKTE